MKKVKPINNNKQTIRTLFASLFKNQAAIDGGRYQPWWIAVILFFVSTIVAVIPTMVVTGRARGSDVFKGPQYELDTGIVKFHQALETNAVDLAYRSNSEGEFELTDEGTSFIDAFPTTISISSLTGSIDIPFYSYSNLREKEITNTEGVSETVVVNFEYLRVYYTADVTASFISGDSPITPERALNNYLQNLSETSINVNNFPNESITSYVILGKTEMFMAVYNPNDMVEGANAIRSAEGNAAGITSEVVINDFYKISRDGGAITPTDADLVSKVIANWSNYVDTVNEPVRIQSFWILSGINFFLFFVLSLFIGIIFFITTRGKYNPNRDIRFFEAMRIGAWLLLTPALLTLVVGLFMPAYAQLIYIMTLGMRTVWMSMKSVQPPAK